MLTKVHHIKITQKDIEVGTKKDCFECALAYALMRDMKIPFRNVSVAKTLRLPYVTLNLPRWLERWIIDYDNGKKVPELEFIIVERRAPLKWEIISSQHEK